MEQMKRSDTVGHVGKVIKKKRCRINLGVHLKRPARVVPMALQKLFECCQRVFEAPGSVPCDSDVQKLCRILDGMKPEDVGLSRDARFFKHKKVEGTPRVTSSTIYRNEKFELCIFFLPATAVIPLHNHPHMTVFSKLLLGTMHIKSYDWADPHSSDHLTPPSNWRLAKLKANKTFAAPCDTSVLYPTSGGNMHEFTAITPCAMLDVLGPPYSSEDGRDCSYYKDIPYHTLLDEGKADFEEEDGCHAWLEEIDTPEESGMDGIEYKGPQIIDTTTS